VIALFLSFATLAQGAASTWRAALAEERYGAAWEALAGETDLLARRRGEVEVLLAAGDPAGALAFAEDGLVRVPDDLELLFRASSAALWLRDADSARDAGDRLAAAVSQAALAPGDRLAWERSVADHRARTAELLRAEERRGVAFLRSRGIALALLVLALVGLLALVAVPGSLTSRPEGQPDQRNAAG
jgi:hypothetical protein